MPAPTPVVAAPFTPMWRPWEEKDVVVTLSAAMQKRKRRSPAAEARSRQRLLQWQEKRDRHRLQSELRTTPIRSIETTKTRLIKRLDVQTEDVVNWGVEGDGVVEKTVSASTQVKLCPCDVITLENKLFWMQVGCANCPDTFEPNMTNS